jgi:hypothetical protein
MLIGPARQLRLTPSVTRRSPERKYTMQASLYVVRFEEQRILAAEISDLAAAELLTEGQPILLSTEQELVSLAQRRGKHLQVSALRAASSPVTEPVKARRHLTRPGRVASRRSRQGSRIRRVAHAALLSLRDAAGLVF